MSVNSSDARLELFVALAYYSGYPDWDNALRVLKDRSNHWQATKIGGDKRTALHLACSWSHVPAKVIEELLIANDRACLVRDSKGQIPLHKACAMGACDDLMFLLLRKFPETYTWQDDEKNMPIFLACKKIHWMTVRFLAKHQKNKGDISSLKVVDAVGRTALHYACALSAPVEVGSDLIALTPEMNLIEDEDGNTPLHLACTTSNDDLIMTILEVCPAAASIRNKKGSTPLHFYVCRTFNREEGVVAKLLEADPTQITVVDEDGNDPLHLACKYASDDFIIALMRTFQKEKFSQTKLHPTLMFNVFNRSTPVLQAVLSIDAAQVMANDGDGQTFLHHFFKIWNMKLRESSLSFDQGMMSNKWKKFYSKFCLLFGAAMDNIGNGFISTSKLNATIIVKSCPWSFFHFALKAESMEWMKEDSDGNLPIHVAAGCDSSHDGELYKCLECQSSPIIGTRYHHKSDSKAVFCQSCVNEKRKTGHWTDRDSFKCTQPIDKFSAIVKDLLSLHSNATSIPDRDGMLPLNIALSSGKTFGYTMPIFDNWPKVIKTTDMKTHMYSFMLAAIKKEEIGKQYRSYHELSKLVLEKETNKAEADGGAKGIKSSREEHLEKFTTIFEVLLEEPIVMKYLMDRCGWKSNQERKRKAVS